MCKHPPGKLNKRLGVEQNKVMKRFGIEAFELRGKDLKPVVHCNPEGRLISGGKVNWLIKFQSYALKLNPTIDDIHKQITKELEAIKEALEMGFEYLDHPFVYKYVKDQVVIFLKSRCRCVRRLSVPLLPLLQGDYP